MAYLHDAPVRDALRTRIRLLKPDAPRRWPGQAPPPGGQRGADRAGRSAGTRRTGGGARRTGTSSPSRP